MILLIGANIAENHPILCQRLLENPGATLIVADPRVTKTAMMADIFLPVKPRSDIALLNGIAHILIRDGLIDRDYIARHTTGFEELRAHVAEVHAGARGGIDRARHASDRAGRDAVRAQQGGLHRLDDGREPLHAGRRDGERDQQSGAADREHRARRRVAVLHHRAVQRDGHARGGLRLGTARLSQVRERRGSRGTGRAVEHRRRSAFRRRAAWPIRTSSRRRWPNACARCGSSPPIRWCPFPNHDVLKQALETVEFLVVQDAFHPTPTSELADLVLPAAMWGEKEGTYTNSERRVSKVNRAVAPPAEARPDFDIFLDLAARLGMRDESVPRLAGPARRVRRVEARVGGPPVRLQRDDLRSRSKREGGMQWGGERLYADGEFATADGRREVVRHRVGAVPRSARTRVSVHPEYRPHRGALAHAGRRRAPWRFWRACRRARGWR